MTRPEDISVIAVRPVLTFLMTPRLVVVWVLCEKRCCGAYAVNESQLSRHLECALVLSEKDAEQLIEASMKKDSYLPRDRIQVLPYIGEAMRCRATPN